MTDADTQKKIKSHETHKKEEGPGIQVHSANAWENADLGDAERKNKFLRLMGAAKKEHHGKIVIGEHKPEHTRDKTSTDQLEHQLEDQYEQSMQHRLAGGRRGHIGLGYHEADRAVETQDDSVIKDRQKDNNEDVGAKQEFGEEREMEEKVEEVLGEDSGDAETSKKRESTEGCKEEDSPDTKTSKKRESTEGCKEEDSPDTKTSKKRESTEGCKEEDSPDTKTSKKRESTEGCKEEDSPNIKKTKFVKSS